MRDLKSDVRKALEEIKYDDWHEGIHTEIMFKAQKSAKPSSKEQEVAVMCGVCSEVLRFRVPPIVRETFDSLEDALRYAEKVQETEIIEYGMTVSLAPTHKSKDVKE